MKPLLLGMNNPHSSNPDHDLHPHPYRATGWRIWKMINDRCGATMVDYLRAFNRKNLMHRPWSKMRAWEAAAASHYYIASGMTVVILGEDVRRTMNLVDREPIQKILIHPQVIRGVTFRYIPHPSGRNRFYNDPVNRELVAMMLEDLYNQGIEQWQRSEDRRNRQRRNQRKSGRRPTVTLPMEHGSPRQ